MAASIKFTFHLFQDSLSLVKPMLKQNSTHKIRFFQFFIINIDSIKVWTKLPCFTWDHILITFIIQIEPPLLILLSSS